MNVSETERTEAINGLREIGNPKPEQACTTPHTIGFNHFKVGILYRDNALILQFYPLTLPPYIPIWWPDLFGEVLSDTALGYFGDERRNDLVAQRVDWGALQSWYMHAQRELDLYPGVEERTLEFLNRFDRELRERLAKRAPAAPGSRP